MNKVLRFSILLLIALLFVSCNQEIAIKDNGNISITINNGIPKGIDSIPIEIKSYEITASRDGFDSVSLEASATNNKTYSMSLSEGEWEIEAIAFNADGIALGKGSATADVIARTHKSCTLTILEYEGRGTLSLEITSEGDSDIKAFVLTKEEYLAGDSGVEIPLSTDSAGTYVGTASLDNGFYYLAIENGSGKLLLNNTIRIIKGQTTYLDGSISGFGDISISIRDNIEKPPVIKIELDSDLLLIGKEITASVTAEDMISPIYAWYLNNELISDATGNTFTFEITEEMYGINSLSCILIDRETSKAWSSSICFDIYDSNYVPEDSSDDSEVDYSCLQITEDGVVSLAYGATTDRIVIPEYLNGIKVTAIADYGFADAVYGVKVELPEGLISIGKGAFQGHTNYPINKIPSTVEYIGDNALSGGYGPSRIDIPNSIKFIGKNAFSRGFLDEIHVDKEEDNIDGNSWAASSCTVYWRSPCLSIDSNGIVSCVDNSIVEVGIPKYVNGAEVKGIAPNAFENCTDLEAIYLGFAEDALEGAPWGAVGATIHYLSEELAIKGNGEVYFIDNTIDEIDIPKYVNGSKAKAIGYNAFSNCTNLMQLEIPSFITRIESGAFRSSYITSIVIPDNVLVIGEDAFENSQLEYIYIDKNEDSIEGAPWGASEAAVFWKNPSLDIDENGIVSCIDTTITEIGIPEFVNNVKVTGVAEDAFINCENLEAIHLGFDTDTFVGAPWGAPNAEVYWKDNTFDVNEDGAIYCIDKAVDALVIPEYVNGQKVKAIGSRAFEGCTNLKEVVLPECIVRLDEYAFTGSSIECVTIPDTMEHIGPYSFYDCTSLVSIDISNNVSSIGQYAFNGCSSLASIIIPDSVEEVGSRAFFGCSSLKSVLLGSQINAISSAMFGNCISLEAISIPSSVKTIGWEAFKNCSALKLVSLNEGLIEIDEYAFAGCKAIEKIIIPDSVIELRERAFNFCSALEAIELGDSLKEIGQYCFDGCDLSEILIPDNVVSIGSGAFCNCENLRSVIIGNGIESISPSDVFYSCSSLRTVVIDRPINSVDGYPWAAPNDFSISWENPSLTIDENGIVSCIDETISEINIPRYVDSLIVRGIASDAFDGCENLKSITIDNDKDAYSGAPWGAEDVAIYWGNSNLTINRNGYIYCINDQISELTIPPYIKGERVVGIAKDAFRGCSNLTSVEIPDFIIDIGISAFENCTSLASVSIGKGTERIRESAFRGCTSLESIVIPDNVKYLYSQAFYSCSSLLTLEIGSGLRVIGGGAFAICTSLENISIPSNIKSIEGSAFNSCYSLKTVNIENGLERIGTDAFRYCSKIESLNLPDSVEFVGWNSFGFCSSLKTVSIGNGVELIESDAFGYCPELETIYIDREEGSVSTPWGAWDPDVTTVYWKGEF